jgi:hypothetical protein
MTQLGVTSCEPLVYKPCALRQESKAAQDARKPGAIDLTIENFQELESTYDVLIDGTPNEKWALRDNS